MSKNNPSVLFLAKNNDLHIDKALKFCQDNVKNLDVYTADWGDPIPEKMKKWKGDYIISYLSRWIVPDYLLKRAKIASINFHPASPDYPGIGCNNFALYEDAKKYGATCHHMYPKVDTGPIIGVEWFPVFPNDTVKTVLGRTYDFQLTLFYKVMDYIVKGKELPKAKEKWGRKAFTRVEFNKLFDITTDMSKKEVERRIRAVNYLHWRPSIKIHGYEFELKDEEK